MIDRSPMRRIPPVREDEKCGRYQMVTDGRHHCGETAVIWTMFEHTHDGEPKVWLEVLPTGRSASTAVGLLDVDEVRSLRDAFNEFLSIHDPEGTATP